MKRMQGLALLAVLLGALMLPGSVQAQGIDPLPVPDGKVVFGGEFTLGSGQTVNGDLISFGGAVVLEEGSAVNGSFVSMGGSGQVDGVVNGDVVAFGAHIDMGASAVVRGDLAMVGASLERDPAAQVIGDVVTEVGPDGVVIPDFSGFEFDGDAFQFGDPPRVEVSGDVPQVSVVRSSAASDIRHGLFNSFAMAAIAILLVLFLPGPTKRVANTALDQPVLAGGVSLVSVFVVVILIPLMVITLILIPAVILVVLAILAAMIFGWVALGWELGERLLTAFNLDWADPLEAGAGTFALTFSVALIGLVPCLGWLAGFFLMLISFGSVVLTRFGYQDYPERPAVIEVPTEQAAKPKSAKKSTAKKTPAKPKTSKKKPPKKSPPKKNT